MRSASWMSIPPPGCPRRRCRAGWINTARTSSLRRRSSRGGGRSCGQFQDLLIIILLIAAVVSLVVSREWETPVAIVAGGVAERDDRLRPGVHGRGVAGRAAADERDHGHGSPGRAHRASWTPPTWCPVTWSWWRPVTGCRPTGGCWRRPRWRCRSRRSPGRRSRWSKSAIAEVERAGRARRPGERRLHEHHGHPGPRRGAGHRDRHGRPRPAGSRDLLHERAARADAAAAPDRRA